MLVQRIAWAVSIGAAMVAGAAFAAKRAYWRPVVPAFVIDLGTAKGADKVSELILVYGEAGSDPFRTGTLLPGQRVSACRTKGSSCVSMPARNEFRTEGSRAQSLQIRLLNGAGNPVIGGVVWTGAAYPKQVRVACDLRISDPHKTCAIAGTTS